jgi:hypothetical protein
VQTRPGASGHGAFRVPEPVERRGLVADERGEGLEVIGGDERVVGALEVAEL